MLAVGLALCSGSLARGQEPPPVRESGEALEGYLASLVDRARTEGRISAAAFVVVRDGATMCQRGFGLARRGPDVPVDPATSVFLAASIGKVFVATAAAQLVERGQLDLNTRVAQLIDTARFDHEAFREVTVEQLLTHTSGIEERMLGSLRPAGSGPPSLAAHFAAYPPRFVHAPGEAIRYSNIGVALAGLVVEKVSGLSFDAYAEQNIFGPLGMKSSSFRQPLPPEMAKELVTERLEKMPIVGPYAAGSLATTPADMARFLCAHLEGGACGERRILSPESEAAMQKRRFGAHPGLQGVALGFFESFVNGRRALFHTGDRGHHSILWMLPEEHTGFYLVYEASDTAGVSFRETFTKAFADRLFPAPTMQSPAADAPPISDALGDLVGTYRAESGSPHTIEKLASWTQQIRISREPGGGLAAQLGPGGERMTLHPRGADLFDSDDGITVAFRKGAGPTRLDFAGGVVDPGDAVRISWYETFEFQMPLLAATFTVFLLRGLSLPAVPLWRRLRRRPPPVPEPGPAARAWRHFGYAGVCAIVGPVLLIGWLASRPFPFTSTPWIVPAGGTLLLIGSGFALAMTAFTAAAWARRDGSKARRIILAGASALSVCALPILLSWNLIAYH